MFPRCERSQWVPDERVSHCSVCSAPFSLMRAKHHCRCCGGIACSSCLVNKLYKYGVHDKTCKECIVKQRNKPQEDSTASQSGPGSLLPADDVWIDVKVEDDRLLAVPSESQYEAPTATSSVVIPSTTSPLTPTPGGEVNAAATQSAEICWENEVQSLPAHPGPEPALAMLPRQSEASTTSTLPAPPICAYAAPDHQHAAEGATGVEVMHASDSQGCVTQTGVVQLSVAPPQHEQQHQQQQQSVAPPQQPSNYGGQIGLDAPTGAHWHQHASSGFGAAGYAASSHTQLYLPHVHHLTQQGYPHPHHAYIPGYPPSQQFPPQPFYPHHHHHHHHQYAPVSYPAQWHQPPHDPSFHAFSHMHAPPLHHNYHQVTQYPSDPIIAPAQQSPPPAAAPVSTPAPATTANPLVPEGPIQRIMEEMEMRPSYFPALHSLLPHDVALIIDDSGSMAMQADFENPLATRWFEVRRSVEVILRVAGAMEKAVDVYFLNRGVFRDIRQFSDIAAQFVQAPRGMTNTLAAFGELWRDRRSRGLEHRPLVVHLFTDGHPTNDDGHEDVQSFASWLRHRPNLHTTYIAILLCTNEEDVCATYRAMEYRVRGRYGWSAATRGIEGVDVTEDFRNEKQAVLARRGPRYAFSFGDYVVKCLVGAIDPQVHAIDLPAGVSMY